MQYQKIDENGITHILADTVVIRENKETGEEGRIYIAGTAEYDEYAIANGFEMVAKVDNSLPSADEIDDMSRGEKDEVLKKILKRI